ncbi:DUF938 domain-containing protein [Sphingomonas arantia]|uniref:DUF938 domain-containing protein n=1 Tax=Sphingomonas arantia TaxID=1460676 RepID=A0ABW4U0Q3_9SPHN
MMDPIDDRVFAPSVLRNRMPILSVLKTVLPSRGLVLEVASGSGEHIIYFAQQLPQLQWQPSDPSPTARASIAAWTATENLSNVRSPIDIDATARPWPVTDVDAIVAINMAHISPWSATQGLLREAGRLLSAGGLLYLYGPFRQVEVTLAPSNVAFDEDLRQRDASWGLRHLADIEAQASEVGLVMSDIIPMPANNLSVILRRL